MSQVLTIMLTIIFSRIRQEHSHSLYRRGNDYKSLSRPLSLSFSLSVSWFTLYTPGRRVPCVRERKVASTRRGLTSAAIPSRVTHYLSSSVVRRGRGAYAAPVCVHVRNVKALACSLFFRSVHRRRVGDAPLTSLAIIRSCIHLTYHAILDEDIQYTRRLDPYAIPILLERRNILWGRISKSNSL